jgi:cytochrome b6-f complex iron-sulfur subunit
MERHEFLSKLGIGLVAVCTGCSLVSCGGKSNDPAPSTNKSGNLFTVDVSNELTNIGDSTVQQGVILVRLATGNTVDAFTAVQVACTHQGASIGYNAAQGIFICPRHGSEFSTSGSVVQGPASSPLQEYKVTINGSTLAVSA